MADTLILPSGLKAIPLTHGKFAIVDESDFEWLSQWKWHLSGKGYARRTETVNGKARGISMHRQIMNTPNGMHTDHIDHDKLNNRRSNLRICSHRQNGRNLTARKNCVSDFKGVTWHKRSGKWQSRIKHDTKTIHLGLFDLEIDAAQAYNDAATRYFADFARPNPVPDGWVITSRNVPKKFNNIRIGKQRASSSVYKGVSHVGTRWVARIKSAGKLRYLGAFDSEDDAAKAYNAAAREAWGDIAYQNPVQTTGGGVRMTREIVATNGMIDGDCQGRCDTTLTERFSYSKCHCGTYPGNLGPCKTYEPGEGRCVYCDHNEECHIVLATLSKDDPTTPR